MQITINGKPETIDACSIAQLVHQRGINPDRLVVEYNMSIVKQDDWPQVQLREGDTLELLSFVGGG